MEYSIHNQIEEKVTKSESTVTNQIEEKINNLESNIDGKINEVESTVTNQVDTKLFIMESTVALAASSIEVEAKLKKFETNAQEKFSELQGIVMELRAESVSNNKIEEVNSDLNDVKNIIQQLSQDIVLNGNEVSQLKLTLQREVDRNISLKDEIKLLTERFNRLLASNIRENITT